MDIAGSDSDLGAAPGSSESNIVVEGELANAIGLSHHEQDISIFMLIARQFMTDGPSSSEQPAQAWLPAA
jgi:hypothetical protein